MSHISVWNIGPVRIYPHLSWNKCLTPNELRDTATKLKSVMTDFEVMVFNESSYTAETNGPWNVTISIKGPSTRNSWTGQIIDIQYIYMIRRDKELNQTFGCPMYNEEYYSIGHRPLLSEYNETALCLLEKELNQILGEGDKIEYFRTQ